MHTEQNILFWVNSVEYSAVCEVTDLKMVVILISGAMCTQC